MRYKGVIFDLDGVICSTDELHYQAWKKLADKIGVPFDRQINNCFRGVARMVCMEILVECCPDRFSPQQKIQLAEEKNRDYVASLSSMSAKDVSRDVLFTLSEMKRLGIKIAIGSSSKNAAHILKRIELYDMFDAISDGNNIANSKPHPEVFLKAAEFLELLPNECLVVEDAVSGVDAGCAGGFDTAGIGDAFSCSKATYPIKKLSDLLKIVK